MSGRNKNVSPLIPVLALLVVLSLASLALPAAEPPAPARMLRHVVAFKFNDDTSPAQIAEMTAAFRELRKQIPPIAAFEAGVNNSPEGLNKGHTHCYLLTFRSESDRDKYLKHPAHEKFVQRVKPLVADVFVVDYWAE
jgi:hypothetical protein